MTLTLLAVLVAWQALMVCGFIAWAIGASEARTQAVVRSWGEALLEDVKATQTWLEDEATARREMPVLVAPGARGMSLVPSEVARAMPMAGMTDLPLDVDVDFPSPPVRRALVPPSPSLPRDPQVTLLLMDGDDVTEHARMTVSAKRRPRDLVHDGVTYVQARETAEGHIVYRRER